MKDIYKYVERIYNIPDIDDTGIRKGLNWHCAFLMSIRYGFPLG